MRARTPVMVGRDAELTEVQRALNATRGGRGSVIFVVGEGGIGKSRLATAAAELGFTANVRVLRGRCSSIGPMLPFRPLTEALMSLMRASSPINFGELGPYRPVLARLAPDLGKPLAGEGGLPLPVLAEAVLRLVALAGRRHGCLLILDDLHDSDAETLAVVEYLTDNLDGQPAMLLGLMRAESCQALDLARSAAQRGSGALVELRRLGAADVRRLAGSRLGIDAEDVPDQVAEQLWADSAGVPLLAEELLSGMLRSGLLVKDAAGWQVTGALRRKVPATLARSLSAWIDRFDPPRRELLSMAAVLGQRFPLALLQAATGMGSRELMRHLTAEPTTQLVEPDEEIPGWYAFRHPLISEALVSLLAPAERGRLSGQAADALDSVFPELPGEWCQASATLHLQAGDPVRAARLFAEAGHRAMAQGAASSAVMLLDKALDLFARDADAQVRADTLAALVYALAEAGMVERAISCVTDLDGIAGLLSRRSRAQLHARLAWAAVVAGRCSDARAQVDTARRLLGPDASEGDTAPIDVVAAHLMLDLPGADQFLAAEALARRAAAVAERLPLPITACQAWQLLAALIRSRDPDEATTCLERAWGLAVQHDLPVEEIHSLVRLGCDDALRDGSIDRLRQVRLKASRMGSVTVRYHAEINIALHAILHGDFATAETLIEQVLASTTRLKILDIVHVALLLRAMLGAHRGRRRDMDAALAELRGWGGEMAQYAPRIHGLVLAWCSLLEEDRPSALHELTLALAAEDKNPTYLQLTGRYGLHLLLRVLAGTASWPEYEAVIAAPVSKLRWDRQFASFANAVLLGHQGHAAAATAAMAEAMRHSMPYATARHLGLRLVSEAAIVDNWGTPADWLRASEEYFHVCKIPAVASACRGLMRQAGYPVTRHRQGIEGIPPALRAAGITTREYEILQLLMGRLSNREIASRLHLSPRTVERHVGSLIRKTGQPDRLTLGKFASHQGNDLVGLV